MQNFGINFDRNAMNFYSSKVFCNGKELDFESWDSTIQTTGGYSHGLRGVGIGSNSRSVRILVPPANSGDISDSMMTPSQVRANFPGFEDSIVIKVWRNSPDYFEPDTIFTGRVESTEYNYATGMAVVTASDGLDDLLDTPVNVESALGYNRLGAFTQVAQALSQAGVGNTPAFHWNKTICTAPVFEHSTRAMYADPEEGAVTTRLYQILEPQNYMIAENCVAVPFSYAENYDKPGDRALVCMIRGEMREDRVNTWDDRTYMRVDLANGDFIVFGYYPNEDNANYGYYVFHSRLGWLWTDKFKDFPKRVNNDGNNNTAFGIIYTKRGITFVSGDQHKIVYSADLPANSSASRVTKVTAHNSICFDVRCEDNWDEGLKVLKALPKTNVAVRLSQNIRKKFLGVIDRVDGLALGTVINRFCEAYTAGFWLDEFGRPTIYDMASMEASNPYGSDVVGSTAMMSRYTPKSSPDWKRVQISHHVTKWWYSTLSPKSEADYSIEVHRGDVERVDAWADGKQEFFIKPESSRVSWGAVSPRIRTIQPGDRNLDGGSCVSATRIRDNYSDEILYTGVLGSITTMASSNYLVTLRDNKSVKGEAIVTRTPASPRGNNSNLVDWSRNQAMPLIRATWKTEKTIAKVTVSKGWKPGMPVLKVGDDETALLLTKENAEALGDEIIRLSSVMKGDIKDYEITPDPRIQLGDRRALRIQTSQGVDRAVLYVIIGGVRMGYSHEKGLVQSLSGVVISETNL